LRENHILSTALRDFKVGGDEDRATERVDENILGHAGHTGVEHHLRAPSHDVGPPCIGGVQALERSVIHRIHAVLDRFLMEKVL
jgi:hypothetical protein